MDTVSAVDGGTRRPPVDTMDEAQDYEERSGGSGLVAARLAADVEATPDEAPRTSHRTVLAVNAFSTALAVGAVALLLSGPLHHAAPIGLILPQLGMFLILFLMSAAASWWPVQLHYRGNTYLFLLEEVPMLLGLVFLSPILL